MEATMEKLDLKNINKSTWESFRFEEIASKISETVDPNKTTIETYVGLEHIDAEDIHIRRKGTPDDVSGGKLRCYPGDVIFGKRRAYQRKAAIVDFDGICSAHAFVFRANPEVIDPKLFPFFLHSDQFMHRMVDISVGGLSPTINWGDLKHQEFLLPPKAEQARLAELLWAMDEVIERELALRNTIEQSKFSVLQNRIKEFSSNKQYQTLGDLGKWTSGGTPSKKNIEYWKNGTIPWITPKDMKGDYLTTSIDFVTEKSIQENKAKIFKKGRVLLVWRSGILQHTLPIARVERDFCINQDLKVFEPKNEKFIEEFVRVFLKVNAEKIRRECVKEGTTVQSIDTNSFMKFAVPEIALDLQKKIIDEEIAFESALISGFSKYKTSKALQKSLINKVFG
jgi:type I restriction enzyme, S subunit